MIWKKIFSFHEWNCSLRSEWKSEKKCHCVHKWRDRKLNMNKETISRDNSYRDFFFASSHWCKMRNALMIHAVWCTITMRTDEIEWRYRRARAISNNGIKEADKVHLSLRVYWSFAVKLHNFQRHWHKTEIATISLKLSETMKTICESIKLIWWKEKAGKKFWISFHQQQQQEDYEQGHT